MKERIRCVACRVVDYLKWDNEVEEFQNFLDPFELWLPHWFKWEGSNKVNLSLWLSCLHLQALSVPQPALIYSFFFNLFTYQPPFSLEDLSSHKNHTSAQSSRGCNKNKIIIIEVTKVKKKIPNNYGKN